MAVDESRSESARSGSHPESRVDIQRLVRRLPIRWRILSIAVLTSAAAILLGALIWNGATTLNAAWQDVRQVRESDALLTRLESESGRLQNLIHRYINEPRAEIFSEILRLREAVLGTLKLRGASDPMLGSSVDSLMELTQRFFEGFDKLRAVQSDIAGTYENSVLKPAREMAGLYAIIEASIGTRDAFIVPALGKSREAFTTTLVAANAYYLSLAPTAAENARQNIQTIEQTVPVMVDLAENDLQRSALAALKERASLMAGGLAQLGEQFASRTTLLSAIDNNQTSMVSTIDRLSSQMRKREDQAQASFDRTLSDIYRKVALISAIFLTAILAGGFLIAHSIREPLRQLMTSMESIVAGRYDRPVRDTKATDEIGEMARAVEVFRDNAIARHQAETELRASKERAEATLDELRATQKNLIDSEKLAALGGLVAGVAHEVNNPVGISLTVASSLARRCETFAAELNGAPLRRSRLDEFVEGNRDAAQQLVTNLQRAGELIQSFKQVAVDRSHADRRQFDLQQATEQIIASLRPALKKSKVALDIDVPKGIFMDSYPGPYGQVLTNLFINAVVHAFPGGRAGTIKMRAVNGARDVTLVIADDGVGMTEETRRRAFDPFFTTRRNLGGTGLGLHIIYNIITQTLGGRIALESELGRGATFHITLPRSAPRGAPVA